MKLKIFMISAMTSMVSLAFGQGSLTPPGAPAPTMRTLTELDLSILQVGYAVRQVESRIDLATVPSAGGYEHYINTPGSYYLSENVMIDATTGGINISVSDVTLDLNGFEINRGSGAGSYGIYVQPGTTGVRVFNGTIRRCGRGVYSRGTAGTYSDLVVSDSSTYGIYVNGANEIRNCRLLNNDQDGISTSFGCSVRDCWVDASGLNGIEVGSGSSVSDCVVRNSGERGIDGDYDCSYVRCVVTGCGLAGFDLSTDSSLVSCVSKDNGSTGFGVGEGSSLATCTSIDNEGMGVYSTGDGVSLVGCMVKNNTSHGIFLPNNAAIKKCIISGNSGTYGIYAGANALVVGCSASYNTSSSSSSCGIKVGTGSTVQECVAWGNLTTHSPTGQSTGAGIYAGAGSLVKDCSACQNKGAGIRVAGSCQVIGNQCDYNGLYGGTGAGIEALGGSNRIADNLLTDNDFGLLIQSSTNLVVNNAAEGNTTTEFSISGTQLKGTIVTDTGIISSDDSLANFDI